METSTTFPINIDGEFIEAIRTNTNSGTIYRKYHVMNEK